MTPSGYSRDERVGLPAVVLDAVERAQGVADVADAAGEVVAEAIDQAGDDAVLVGVEVLAADLREDVARPRSAQGQSLPVLGVRGEPTERLGGHPAGARDVDALYVELQAAVPSADDFPLA